jgi:hypothetical protein
MAVVLGAVVLRRCLWMVAAVVPAYTTAALTASTAPVISRTVIVRLRKPAMLLLLEIDPDVGRRDPMSARRSRSPARDRTPVAFGAAGP